MTDRAALAGPAAGVTFAAGVAGGMALADAPYPRPGADPATVRRYFTGSAGAARVSVAGQLLSAASLAAFTTSVADASAAALHKAAFAVGGPVHTAGFGLLLGALGLAGLRTGELPRPLAVAGLASAAASLASPLYFLAEPAGWLIPAGRFSGLVVGGIAGARLGRRPR
jgi:hypothetical protein